MSAMFASSIIGFKAQTMRSMGAVQARKVVHTSTRTTQGLTIKARTVLSPNSLPNIAQLVTSKVIPTAGLCIKCPLRTPSPDSSDSPSIVDAQPFTPRYIGHLSVTDIVELREELDTQRMLKFMHPRYNPPPHGTRTWPPAKEEKNSPETAAAVAEDDSKPIGGEMQDLLPADLLSMLDE